ncbi:hypothetical protein ACFYWY_37690 [Streptomyces sp. NPDC002870]|uniref:hypothetical protein n=1 Tax=Streptomyces sp. NPDC002870 TaxID=3364666 RepID=UPI0036755BD7
MVSDSYHSDLERQKQALEKIEEAIKSGEELLGEFVVRYVPMSDWMGWTDDFAMQMKSQRFYEGITETLDPMTKSIRAAWTRALQVSVEVQKPQQGAVEDIEHVRREQGVGAEDDGA